MMGVVNVLLYPSLLCRSFVDPSSYASSFSSHTGVLCLCRLPRTVGSAPFRITASGVASTYLVLSRRADGASQRCVVQYTLFSFCKHAAPTTTTIMSSGSIHQISKSKESNSLSRLRRQMNEDDSAVVRTEHVIHTSTQTTTKKLLHPISLESCWNR